MYPFTYTAVTKDGQAIDTFRSAPDAMFLAGGTNLIDEMKLNVRTPKTLVDINGLGLDKIEDTGAGLTIGALVRNSDLARDPRVIERYPVLSQALLSGASAQLRNMATTGGNLLQKTRCTYYRDIQYEQCNKRNPGSGCAAIEGYNRMHALLGTSDKCIATHPSDMCVALIALDAKIHTMGGRNRINNPFPASEFFVSYGEDPAKEHWLEPGELITAVSLPVEPWFKRSLYLKTRDRASYEFALASVAVAVELEGRDKTIKNIRLVLGGVATVPWRAVAAEHFLAGNLPVESVFARAADIALQDAKPQKYNAFKVELAKRTIVQALMNVTTMA